MASKICKKESGGDPNIESPTGDIGLFQIHYIDYQDPHGNTIPKEHWQDISNNLGEAINLYSTRGWEPWTPAYEYGCYNDERRMGCGFIPGKPSWQDDCPLSQS